MTPLNDKGFYAVEIPEGAVDPKIVESDSEENLLALEFDIENTDEESGFYGECVTHQINLPKGKWKLIFTTDQVTEDKAALVVEKFESSFGWRLDGDVSKLPKITMYMNYKYTKPVPVTLLFPTSLESWESLLCSLNLTGRYAIIKQVK